MAMCDALVSNNINLATAEIIDMRVSSIVDEQVVNLDVSLAVENQNAQAVHLVDIEFLVEDLDESMVSSDPSSKKVMVTKQIQHSCLIQPQTSEIITVPLQFVYKNVKPESAATPSRSGNAGRIIPFTLHARLNCFETIRGMFAITISKLKQFLTIVDQKLGIGKLRGFVPPTAMFNGAHFVSITPDQVVFKLDARVKNGNPLPIQLLYTNVSIEVNKIKALDVNKIDHNIMLSARSSRRVTVPYTLSIKDLLTREDVGLKHGSVVPYSVKLEYWFKENFHGMYKVSVEKTGELPVPAKSAAKAQSASFNMDEHGRPVAKVCIKLENKNSFQIKVTNIKIEIVRNSDGVSALVAEDGFLETDRIMEIEGGESGSIWMAASAGSSEEDFGSALWDTFTGDSSRFSVVSTVESDTKFGKMIS